MKRIARTILMSGLLMIFSACSTPAPGTTAGLSTSTPQTQANTTAVNTTLPATPAQTTALQTTTPKTMPPATTAAIQPKHETEYYFIKEGVPEPIDLDLDGKMDEIALSRTDLTINSVSFRSVVEKDYFLDDDPIFDRFLVTDLNYLDDQIELGLMVRGPSDDPSAFFFTYKEGKLRRIGGVPTDMTEDAQRFDGKGHITGRIRFSILQTWFGKAIWELTADNKIRLVPDQIFPAVTFGDMPPVELKDSLPIYKNRGDKKPFTELRPQEVEFLATDNKAWIQIKGEDGKTGWFKVKDYDSIVDLNKSAGEVFMNLISAD